MITSTSNSQVKLVINLQSKAKVRREENAFVVEGIKMVLEAPQDRIVRIFASDSFANEHKNGTGRIKWDSPKVEIVSDNVFNQMSDTKTPQGIMAIVSMKQYAPADILSKENAFIVVCEDIQDPGNLGTIIRTGEGAGVSGIIITKNSVDIYNPKTIRSTMGSIYRVPFIYTQELTDVLRQMKSMGISVYATHLNGNNMYADEDYSGKCAFLIGNEGNGLKEETSAMADKLIKIPMEGSVESLNAAVSAAVMMYEVKRQRMCK
jgi:TrmH family RNA methyltransferase